MTGITRNDARPQPGGTKVPPQADIKKTIAGLSVNFDASGSLFDGAATPSYNWDFGDGATATGVTASHQYATAGLKTVQLTVNDGLGQTDTAKTTIEVTNGQSPVVDSISCEMESENPPRVRITATYHDPDGDIAELDWYKDPQDIGTTGPETVTPDGQNLVVLPYTADAISSFTPVLVVVDQKGNKGSASCIVSPGLPPVLSATPLNDTGITWGGDYPSGNNTTCTSNIAAPQDCNQGRDATHNDDSDGHAGFSFTKLDPMATR